ncbi:YcgN family cysteine cluster protein [Pseudoalteromonas citrea]|nr:YcgN family cysteine cluster protein [Pseudoalteromonas citrea]
MTQQQWESICDGCGKCCLHSFIDSDEEDDDFESTDFLREGEELIYTSLVCQYIDEETCGCTRYEQRQELVPSCVKLTKENLKDIFFMPQSCSYRRLYEGRGLASWHPLLNDGDKSKMHDMGISAKGRITKDNTVDIEEDFEHYVAQWPTYDCD